MISFYLERPNYSILFQEILTNTFSLFLYFPYFNLLQIKKDLVLIVFYLYLKWPFPVCPTPIAPLCLALFLWERTLDPTACRFMAVLCFFFVCKKSSTPLPKCLFFDKAHSIRLTAPNSIKCQPS